MFGPANWPKCGNAQDNVTAENKITLQPGPVFYEVFTGALRVLGTDLKDWSEANGVLPNNAKFAATGGWNGPKAKLLRDKMIATIGEDVFIRLYRDRMAREERGAA